MIKNPEIAALVPTLLMGLTDPNEYTKYSLDILLQVNASTAFVFDGWMYSISAIILDFSGFWVCRLLMASQFADYVH